MRLEEPLCHPSSDSMKKEGGNSTQMAAIKLEEVYKPDKHDCFLMFFSQYGSLKTPFPHYFSAACKVHIKLHVNAWVYLLKRNQNHRRPPKIPI